jgi:hypothetical protein
MSGYGEKLGAWQDARGEVALGKSTPKCRLFFKVCRIYTDSPYSCRRLRFVSTCVFRIVAGTALAAVRAPPLVVGL